MAVSRVKFRCSHCNRLLSAPMNRIGRAVACPKCVQATMVPVLGAGAELDPKPDSPLSLVPAPAAGGVNGDPGVEMSSDIPEEVLAIQPEDIRAEVVLSSVELAAEDRLACSSEPVDFRESETPDVHFSPEEILQNAPFSSDETGTDTCFFPTEAPSGEAVAPKSDIPAIKLEPEPVHPTLIDPGGKPVASVTLPASVVLAWSLFVLFALAFSFIAGLFVGHYHWKHF